MYPHPPDISILINKVKINIFKGKGSDRILTMQPPGAGSSPLFCWVPPTAQQPTAPLASPGHPVLPLASRFGISHHLKQQLEPSGWKFSEHGNPPSNYLCKIISLGGVLKCMWLFAFSSLLTNWVQGTWVTPAPHSNHPSPPCQTHWSRGFPHNDDKRMTIQAAIPHQTQRGAFVTQQNAAKHCGRYSCGDEILSTNRQERGEGEMALRCVFVGRLQCPSCPYFLSYSPYSQLHLVFFSSVFPNNGTSKEMCLLFSFLSQVE